MTRNRSVGGLLVAVLMAVVLWWTQGDGATTDPPPAPDGTASVETPALEQDQAPEQEQDQGSGLPLVAAADLPPEARDTLALIERGGPFPHEEDGSVFFNREGILPDREQGYYREHTVETPGSDDRGARRIVTGGAGELYWTDDHYSSFSRIEQAP